MGQLKKEDLEKLKSDSNTCIVLVRDLSSKYNSKIHYQILTQSVIASINRTVNSIIRSTEYLDVDYIMCDEIDPIKLTDFLFEFKQYDIDKEIAYYYLAFYLKRKINEFYMGLKENRISMGFAMLNDRRGMEKYYNSCNERMLNGLKLLRSKT